MAPPLDREGVTFWLRGGSALWQGLKRTGLKRGDAVLFPAYHCGIELDVLRQAGLRCVFYGIDRRLRIDLNEIESVADTGTRALYVIHYFGFSHPAAELRRYCTDKGWVLIEDCAQALFARSGGQPVGTFGDIGIYSLHKFLPIPCCGALIENHGRHRGPVSEGKRPPFGFVLRQTVDWMGRGPSQSALMNSAAGLGLRRAVSRSIHGICFDAREIKGPRARRQARGRSSSRGSTAALPFYPCIWPGGSRRKTWSRAAAAISRRFWKPPGHARAPALFMKGLRAVRARSISRSRLREALKGSLRTATVRA